MSKGEKKSFSPAQKLVWRVMSIFALVPIGFFMASRYDLRALPANVVIIVIMVAIPYFMRKFVRDNVDGNGRLIKRNRG